MAADKSNSGPADSNRVNVNEDYEVRYWTAQFGCSEAQLSAAVKAVGVMVSDVEKELRKRKNLK